MILNTFKSVSIGSTAASRISEGRVIGYVHSIFKSSFFIITHSGKLICIVKNELSNGPINIKIELTDRQDLQYMSLEVGDIVVRQKNSLFVGKCVEINLDTADIWESPKMIKIDCASRLSEKINIVKRLVLERGRHDGLGQLLEYELEIINGGKIPTNLLNKFAARALPHLRDLVTGILENKFSMVEKSSGSIIGLGLGLTPSADDVLAGIMAGLYMLGNNTSINMSYLFSANTAIISQLDKAKTTLVSKEFLEHAARGEIGETVSDLINAILSMSENFLTSKVELLLTMGATSGTDITLGVILGLRIGLELLHRGAFTSSGRITYGYS